LALLFVAILLFIYVILQRIWKKAFDCYSSATKRVCDARRVMND